jgi:hypothetical protein
MELTPRERVLLLGKSLQVGETDNRTLCYFCDGGESKDKSFAVTRINSLTVKYKCHRAKCSKAGTVHLNGSGEEIQSVVKKFEPTPYNGQVMPLEYSDMDYLDGKYGLDLNKVIQAGWMKAPSPNPGFGLFLPVWGPTGALRGSIVRRETDGKKEVRTYKILDEPWLCWYRTSFAQIVLVEDQISALKAASFATSVALLGAELTFEKMDEILAHAKGPIWLALDKDAHKKTFEYLKRYREYCNGNFNARLLSKDVKNMTYKEIGSMFKA